MDWEFCIKEVDLVGIMLQISVTGGSGSLLKLSLWNRERINSWACGMWLLYILQHIWPGI